MRDEVVRARVSSQLKHDSEIILGKLGMSMSDAIRLFLNQVTMRNEFPIELKIPNKETLNAMNESVTDEVYDSSSELFDEVLKSSVKN